MLTENQEFIGAFEKVIVYYDGSQKELSSMVAFVVARYGFLA